MDLDVANILVIIADIAYSFFIAYTACQLSITDASDVRMPGCGQHMSYYSVIAYTAILDFGLHEPFKLYSRLHETVTTPIIIVIKREIMHHLFIAQSLRRDSLAK